MSPLAVVELSVQSFKYSSDLWVGVGGVACFVDRCCLFVAVVYGEHGDDLCHGLSMSCVFLCAVELVCRVDVHRT